MEKFMFFRGVAGKTVGWNFVAVASVLLSTHTGLQAAPKTPITPKTPTTSLTTKLLTTKSQAPAPKRDKHNEALLHLETAFDLLSQGNKQDAKKQAEQAKRLAGDSAEINFLLAYLLEREGQIAQAQQHAQSAAKNSELSARYAEQLTQNLSSTRMFSAGQVLGFADDSSEELIGEETFVGGVPTRVTQTQKNLAALETAMIAMVNQERVSRGMNELKLDSTLADTARAHSTDMRDRNYFAHEAPTASLRAPLDRYMAVFSIEPRMVAENLYNVWGSRRNPSQADIVEAQRKLMESPGHRANILLNGVTHIGIGIIANANGDLWMTQMFSQPGN
jgi:uncharacterized protein YkwD